LKRTSRFVGVRDGHDEIAAKVENVSAQDSGSEAVASVVVVLTPSAAIDATGAPPAPVHTKFSFTQLSESEDTDMTTDDEDDDAEEEAKKKDGGDGGEKGAKKTFAEVIAKRLGKRETSQSSGDTAVALAKTGAQTAGARQRSFTLNAQAKAFVPNKLRQSAGSVSRASTQLHTSFGGNLTYSNVVKQLSEPQMQALGRSVSGNSAARAETGSRKSFSEKAATNGGKELQPAAGGRTTAAVANKRCRFWPSCNNKNCKYVHPAQVCKMYPSCSYGNNCIYIHPSDAHKINIVVSRGNNRRSKRSQLDILRLNNLEAYVADS
ncbi:hypothetical protein FBU59_006256, partial [Linderina macrospora]